MLINADFSRRVVGAGLSGLSGLSAAFLLEKQGISDYVRSTRAMSRSENEIGRCQIPHGAHDDPRAVIWNKQWPAAGTGMTSTRQMTIPASHFGMVLGLAGLGQAWRAATRLWALPPLVGETLLAVAGLTWAVLIAGYMWQAIPRFEQVQAEFLHPVQGGTPALVSAATSLVAMAAQPYSTTVAWILSIMGIGWHVGFSLWHTGTLWQGGRNSKDTLPTVYLPGGGE